LVIEELSRQFTVNSTLESILVSGEQLVSQELFSTWRGLEAIGCLEYAQEHFGVRNAIRISRAIS
jgi:hypothetical protein